MRTLFSVSPIRWACSQPQIMSIPGHAERTVAAYFLALKEISKFYKESISIADIEKVESLARKYAKILNPENARKR